MPDDNLMEDGNIRVTPYSNIIQGCTPTETLLLERAFYMWQRGYTFSYMDVNIGHGHFRKTISSLRKKGKVELDFRDSRSYYRIKGLHYPGDKRRVTFEGMGVGKEFLDTLVASDVASPSLHDIKLKFPSTIVHKYLSRINKPNPSNNGIIHDMYLNENVQARIQAYPKTVTVDISSTYKPFACDLGGTIKLLDYVGRIYERLHLLCEGRIDFPEAGEWICTHYHFAKDAGREYCGPKFEIKFNELSGGLVRFYSKEWKDGEMRGRMEALVSPKCKLDEVVKMLIGEEMQKIENRKMKNASHDTS